jgi:hypothetical protein
MTMLVQIALVGAAVLIVILGHRPRRPRRPQITGQEVPPGAPPTVIVDTKGATAYLSGRPRFHIAWERVERVAIRVVVVEPDYSEAFWSIDGGGEHFVAPMDVVADPEDLKGRLLTLPGFDTHKLQMAELSEAKGEAGEFVCWVRQATGQA